MLANPAALAHTSGPGSSASDGQYLLDHHAWNGSASYPSVEPLKIKPKKPRKARRSSLGSPVKTSAGQGQGSSAKGPIRRRISRACDQCNQLRTKCDGQKPCAHCIEIGLECEYARQQKKRGKASRKDLAAQAAAQMAQASSPPSASLSSAAAAITTKAAAAAAAAVGEVGVGCGLVTAAGWPSLIDDDPTPTEVSEDCRVLDARGDDWAVLEPGHFSHMKQHHAMAVDGGIPRAIDDAFGRAYSWDQWSTSTDDASDFSSHNMHVPAPASSTASISSASSLSSAFEVDGLPSPTADMDLESYDMLHPGFPHAHVDMSSSNQGIMAGLADHVSPHGFDERFISMTGMSPSHANQPPYSTRGNSGSNNLGNSNNSASNGLQLHQGAAFDPCRRAASGTGAMAQRAGAAGFAWTQMLPSLARYTPYNPPAFQKNDSAELEVLATAADPFTFLPATATTADMGQVAPVPVYRPQTFLPPSLHRIA